MSNILLERLVVVYGEPDSSDPAAYLRELSKLLAKFSDATLERAGDHVLATHRGRMFPTPSECVVACETVLAEQIDSKPPEGQRHPEWSDAAFRIADRLICSPMGRDAAREGWITQLHDYCRKARQMPDAGTIAALKREARLFEESYGQVCRGEGLPALNASLRKLGEKFLERRDQLAAGADGGDAG